MAVVQKMALGIGIGVVAAGAGVWFGGTRGVLAGAAVGGAALVCVNGHVMPLPEILKTLSAKRKAILLDLIISLTRLTFELWSLRDPENVQLNKRRNIQYVILGAESRGILHQILKLISAP